MSASLVVLAAGMGTRFKGGIKQLTPVGSGGELLMEYSVFDAVKSGFDNIIFIIRKDIEEQFRALIGNKLAEHVNVKYCFQEMDDLPEGYSLPEGRTKPWGTVHAVLAAAEHINEPFLIINADDYYGCEAYRKIYDFLTSSSDASEQCMGGFILKNTLSSSGTVTRGICVPDEKMCLSSVTETYRVSRQNDGVIRGTQNDELIAVDENSIVSMNMWGFKKEILPMLEGCFADFMKRSIEDNTIDSAELALPTAVDELIKQGSVIVKVLPTDDKWYGMTHREDMPEIIAAFADMTEKGIYTSPLEWKKSLITQNS